MSTIGRFPRFARARRPDSTASFPTKEQQFDAGKIGMWLFLATEILLFGGLFVGFALMQQRYPEAFLAAHHHLDRTMGAVNTVVLLISSFTMVMAVWAAQTSRKKLLIALLVRDSRLRVRLPGRQVLRVLRTRFHDGLLPGKFYHHRATRFRTSSSSSASTS